jgi:hypothetical protein
MLSSFGAGLIVGLIVGAVFGLFLFAIVSMPSEEGRRP